ncbi:MAG: hemolysin family protein [Verrucomicrobia bacterium]|nr:hemolysin family protein [Verrucomicrobiota bacterium]
MSPFVLEIGVVLVLILANGLFATAEMAFVASRKSRLRRMAEEGKTGAEVALEMAENPTRFLSTVQVGITLIGILAGAYSGARLAGPVALQISRVEWVAPYAGAISLGLVVSMITILSLILGELVPKRLALSNPERFYLRLAGAMRHLSKLAGPIVDLIGGVTDWFLSLMGVPKVPEEGVTEEEVRMLIRQGQHAGVFEKTEVELVEGAMRLDQERVADLMTPQSRIVWLDMADPDEVNWRKIVASNHTYFPVFEGQRDNVRGMVSVKAMWANLAAGLPARLKDLLTAPLIVPETLSAVRLLETFKQRGKHLALVSDEFGNIKGLVSLIDVFEAIIGKLPEEGSTQRRYWQKREDGSFLVDAMLEIAELKTLLGLGELPLELTDHYRSAGGFVMSFLGRIPKEGDHFEWGGHRFEVIDMDRHRIDKILVTGSTRSPDKPAD